MNPEWGWLIFGIAIGVVAAVTGLFWRGYWLHRDWKKQQRDRD